MVSICCWRCPCNLPEGDHDLVDDDGHFDDGDGVLLEG